MMDNSVLPPRRKRTITLKRRSEHWNRFKILIYRNKAVMHDVKAVTNDGVGAKTLVCRFCGVRFRFAEHYERHYKDKHPGNKAYSCQHCGFHCTRRNNFARHAIKKHPKKWDFVKEFRNQLMKCELCGLELRGAMAFQEHAFTHSDVKMMECDVCHAKFRWKKSLVFHKLKKHIEADVSLECKFCRKFFPRSDELEEHKATCRESWEKRKIGATTLNIRDVQKFDELTTCYECGFRFETLINLTKHFKMAHPSVKRVFSCKLCKTRFASTQQLEIHVLRKHPKIGEYHTTKKFRKLQKFVCEFCGDEIEGIGRYEQHGMTAHPAEKLFRCELCRARFALRYVLSRHIKRIHSSETKYSCRYCDKFFKLVWECRKHEKSCEKLRQKKRQLEEYYCHKCRKTLRGNKRYHVKCHNGYDHCEFCNKRFHKERNPDGLSAHIRLRHPHKFNNNVYCLLRAAEILDRE